MAADMLRRVRKGRRGQVPMPARFVVAALLTLAAVHAIIPPAWSATFKIVALGASNTAGKGVPLSQAYPAQLQALLRAKGYDVVVRNAGTSGETTASMLSSLASAVPAGTNLVLFQPGTNDARTGVGAERASNVQTIVQALERRGIAVITLDRFSAGIPKSDFQPDGQHLTPEGYRMIAERLLPQVESALGRR